MNAIAIMICAMTMGGALEVAQSTTLALSEKKMSILIFSQFIKQAWRVGSLFFGLWLIPIGYIVVSSQRMPMWLGRILILGGVGYILSAFLLFMDVRGIGVKLLTIPASVGEFWMIGYLLIFGIRPIK